MTPVSRSRRRTTSNSICVSRWRMALARMVRRRVASTGFSRKSYAPSFIASTANSIDPMAVSTTTVRFASSPDPASVSLVKSPIPSIRGIFKSVMTMAGFQATAFSHPSTPSRGLRAVSPSGDQLRKPHQRIRLVFDDQNLGGVLHQCSRCCIQ
jgi:hypothetical protein